jgi:hypothetical protein
MEDYYFEAELVTCPHCKTKQMPAASSNDGWMDCSHCNEPFQFQKWSEDYQDWIR